MIDTVALLLLVLALLFAPSEAKEFKLDAVNPSSGRVETLVARRTEKGFTVKTPSEEGTLTVERQADKPLVFNVTLPSGVDKVEIDASDARKQLEAATGDERTATVGDHTIHVTTRGDLVYVICPGSETLYVTRAAATPLRGVVHVRKESVKSVEAYRYGDITVVLENGRRLTLVAKAPLTRDQLVALDGKKVELTGTEHPGAAPDAREQTPVGSEGKPLERAAVLEATAIKARLSGAKPSKSTRGGDFAPEGNAGSARSARAPRRGRVGPVQVFWKSVGTRPAPLSEAA